MALGLRKNAEIQEIQTESLYAQPQSSFKPVQAWALARRRDPRRAALRLDQVGHRSVLRAGASRAERSADLDEDRPRHLDERHLLGFPVAIYYFIIRPWRRERRITTDGMLMVAFGLLFFQDPLLNYFNTWCTYNTWLWNRGSWVLDIPGWVSWGKPGADDGGAAPHERPRLLVRGPLVHDARMLGDAACQVALAEHRRPRVARRRVRVHLLLRRRDGGVLPDADGPLHVPRSHPVSLASSPARTTSTRSTRDSCGAPSRPGSALSASSRTIAAGPSSSAAWNASRAGP